MARIACDGSEDHIAGIPRHLSECAERCAAQRPTCSPLNAVGLGREGMIAKGSISEGSKGSQGSEGQGPCEKFHNLLAADLFQ